MSGPDTPRDNSEAGQKQRQEQIQYNRKRRLKGNLEEMHALGPASK